MTMTLSKKQLEDLMAAYVVKIAKAKRDRESKVVINHYKKELRLLEMAYDDCD